MPSLNVARASPAVVVVNSRVLVIGGISVSQAPSDKIEMFDGEKWNLISVLPEALMERVLAKTSKSSLSLPPTLSRGIRKVVLVSLILQ